MSDTLKNTAELLEAFEFDGKLSEVKPLTDGHINDTFRFDFVCKNGEKKSYLVQVINTNVFKDPDVLMKNIIGVTNHIHKKIVENGGDPEREGLYVRYTKSGEPYYTDKNGTCWRCYNFIKNTVSGKEKNAETLRKAAEAFGKFQQMLSDYPGDTLAETIPNFHNTVSRFSDFRNAVADNISGRASQAQKEIDFVLEREKDCSVLVDLLNAGVLPLRVTHNDTKLNNVMFDNDTKEGICVVDLDTVMPGLSLYDFGDSIRFGANTACEDENDLSKVKFSLENFKAYTEGYLSTAGKSLTEKEIEYLPFSSKLMTLECGMRFLGDFINGDTYFKTDYPEHNLVRCRTQLKLVEEMENHMDEMKKIVENCRKELNI